MFRRIVAIALLAGALHSAAGCARHTSPVSADSPVALTGTLTAMRDDRPVDGGVMLTLEVAPGSSEVVLVPGLFRGVPPEEIDRIRLMNAVVDASTPGDRLRAVCARGPNGELSAETLERI